MMQSKDFFSRLSDVCFVLAFFALQEAHPGSQLLPSRECDLKHHVPRIFKAAIWGAQLLTCVLKNLNNSSHDECCGAEVLVAAHWHQLDPEVSWDFLKILPEQG